MSGNMSHNSAPFQRSQSADFAFPQPRHGLLMAHSSGTLPVLSSPIGFQRRTVEGARHLRDSFNSALRQIEPLVVTARNVRQNAITISELLSRPTSENHLGAGANPQDVPSPASLNYISINMEGSSSNDPAAQNPINNIPQEHHHQEGGGGTQQNNELEDNVVDRVNVNPIEAQQALQVVFKYIPFLLILLAKAVYDFHEGIFILVILFGTFSHANSTVKNEALKRSRRSIGTLTVALIYILVCMLAIHFLFQAELHNFNLIMNLVLIRTFNHPLSVFDLLWVVTITDFTLKLMTVMVKIILTMMPGKVVEFKKRGKIYLFIEAISQLYRSIATIQPWLYYLLESYQGPEKIVAVFLSAFYMISKGSDLMFKVKLFKTAFFKLLQTVLKHKFLPDVI